jgi:hypothetical protein
MTVRRTALVSKPPAGKNRRGVLWELFFFKLRVRVRLYIILYDTPASPFKIYPELTNTNALINSNSDKYFMLEPAIIYFNLNIFIFMAANISHFFNKQNKNLKKNTNNLIISVFLPKFPHKHVIPPGFSTAVAGIFCYRHVIPMGFPTVVAVIFYQHVIPPGFLTAVAVIFFYRHVIPMGFPTVMAMIFYQHAIPPGFLTAVAGIFFYRHVIPMDSRPSWP